METVTTSRRIPARQAARLLVERRVAARLRPALPTTCQIHERSGACEPRARVFDISADGIRLITRRPWEADTELSLLVTNAACTYALAVCLTVVRSTLLPGGEYAVAGRFDRPLELHELQPFVL